MDKNQNYQKKVVKRGLALVGSVVLFLGIGKGCEKDIKKAKNTERPKKTIEDFINRLPQNDKDLILKPGTITPSPEITPSFNPDEEIHITFEPMPSETIDPSISGGNINKDNEGKKPGKQPSKGSQGEYPPAASTAPVEPTFDPNGRPGTIVQPGESPVVDPSDRPGTIVAPTPSSSPVVTPTPTPTPSPSPVVTPTPTPVPTPTPSPSPSPSPSPKPDRPGGGNHGGSDRPTPTPSPSPSPSPSPEPDEPDVPVHKHSFGAWHSLDDDLEQRECSCGEKETRAHAYSDVKTTYESTKDGSHYKVTTSICSTCGHKKIEKDLGPCYYGDLEWNDTFEYKTCLDCGYELKVKDHSTSTEISYDYLKDDTHKKTTTTTCSTCSYTHTDEEILDCEYGSLQWNDTEEYKVCEVCDHEKTIGKHNLGKAQPNVVGIVVYPCENDDCGYEKEHKHVPGEKQTTYSDDECHDVVIKCEECGEVLSTDSVAHNYVTIEMGVKTKIVKCTGCADEKEVDLTPEEIEDNLENLLGETTDNTVSFAYDHSLVRTRRKY